jgi:hypothetical protein
MSTELQPDIVETSAAEGMEYLDESLIEQLDNELRGRVTREQIRRVVTEIASEFRTATVTAFVPIFIQRLARERLATLVADNGKRGDGSESPDLEMTL